MMKRGLERVNKEKFAEMYQTNKYKDFTFSVFLPKAIFRKEEIELENSRIIINFSTGNADLAINYYNAFMANMSRFLPFGKNKIKIDSVKVLETPQILGNVVIFKTLSPIICRDHDQNTKKDWFYSWESNEFIPVLKRNLKFQLKEKYGENIDRDVDMLVFEPINIKKTVVKNYNMNIEATLGIFRVSGRAYLLQELQKSGIGSLKGMGFGMIENT